MSFLTKGHNMLEVSEGEIQTITMDHHGLVAAVCQDLKIAERINSRLPPNSRKKVSSGIATVAMIINGLGFTNRTLYLAHRFFESKPIERLLKTHDYLWVTRVPETITEAKNLVEKPSEDISWIDVGNGYKISSFDSFYGEIKQRWLLVFSEQAYHREKKTLEKKITKEAEKLKQALWHLSNQIFHCEKDAFKTSKKN